jgi:hypothetical protein
VKNFKTKKEYPNKDVAFVYISTDENLKDRQQVI